jgi:hypothetical protein
MYRVDYDRDAFCAGGLAAENARLRRVRVDDGRVDFADEAPERPAGGIVLEGGDFTDELWEDDGVDALGPGPFEEAALRPFRRPSDEERFIAGMVPASPAPSGGYSPARRRG